MHARLGAPMLCRSRFLWLGLDVARDKKTVRKTEPRACVANILSDENIEGGECNRSEGEDWREGLHVREVLGLDRACMRLQC